MQIFKVLSVLLNYPEAEMLLVLDEMLAIIEQENMLNGADKQTLSVLLNSFRHTDLLESQENYVALFDRGRFLSLHIFEHVHGESRERGQAMVNLLQLYETHGFEINTQELPDFIPLFLEFLSQLNIDEAKSLLQDAMPVLALLGARLDERGSHYAAIFHALSNSVGKPEDLEQIRQQVSIEGEDETLVNLDAIWEEEMVSFMASSTRCQTPSSEINPITILPREQIIASSSTKGVSL